MLTKRKCKLQGVPASPGRLPENELMPNGGTSAAFYVPGLAVSGLLGGLRTLCWVVTVLLGRPRPKPVYAPPPCVSSAPGPAPHQPTLLSRNSSRYLSSLALVILRNTDSRHFSDTVILPILKFRFFFPLPPGSLVCFSPVVWRCWWLDGAAGEKEQLVRAGLGENAAQPLGARSQPHREPGPVTAANGPTTGKCLQG